ncbi:MAG: NAD(+) synthase [Acidobacteriota bacterium]
MTSLPDRMAAWLRQRVDEAGARGIVVGLSGGVDSAVVARVAQLAMGDEVVALIMPAHSNPQDESDARLVADQFTLRTIRVDLSGPFDSLVAAIEGGLAAHPSAAAGHQSTEQLAIANVKPRLRMTTLYCVANRLNYLVAGTGNRSEIAIGYYTKYGDGGVDLLPLASLVKSEVRALAAELGVPRRVIDKPPSAGLWLGQTDEGEMGFTYAELERFLREGPQAIEPAPAERIDRLVRASEHKRRMPAAF